MLRKAIAFALLILITLPFTAPFPTCDVTTMFGDGAPITAHQTSLAATVEDGSHTVPMFASSGRIGLRIKFVSQLETAAGAHRIVAPASGAVRSAPSAQRRPGRASLTALRI